MRKMLVLGLGNSPETGLTCTNSPETCNGCDRYSPQLYSNGRILRVHMDGDCTPVVSAPTMVQGSRSNRSKQKTTPVTAEK